MEDVPRIHPLYKAQSQKIITINDESDFTHVAGCLCTCADKQIHVVF